jgi:hypothetical protein
VSTSTVRRRLADTLRAFIADAGRIHLTRDEALAVALSDELPDVLQWLTRSDVPRPRVLGTPHVVGEYTAQCLHCKAIIGGAAPDYGLSKWAVGDWFGTDCDGPCPTPPRKARR